MAEVTSEEAKTIHRLLEVSFITEEKTRQHFEKNEEEPLTEDVIILDEFSMVDTILFSHILKAISEGTRIILVGDANQLPSVGAGSVLKDIIESEKIDMCQLEKIYRQKEQSSIAINAYNINQGVDPDFKDNKDFFIVKRNNSLVVLEEIINLIEKRIPTFKECKALEDIQVLTPMKKGVLGSINLNEKLQERLNKEDEFKMEIKHKNIVFREKDKVMQIKNNYQKAWKIENDLGVKLDEGMGVFNGDQGRIDRINKEKNEIVVLFDDEKEVVYKQEDFDELIHSYAITVHKSQGSEYKIVILPILSGPPMLMNRNLLYTAVTRAKEMLIIAGSQSAVNTMVANDKEQIRYSGLSKMLLKY